jgi:hypothetical protein
MKGSDIGPEKLNDGPRKKMHPGAADRGLTVYTVNGKYHCID